MEHNSLKQWSAIERSAGYLVSGFSLAVLEQVKALQQSFHAQALLSTVICEAAKAVFVIFLIFVSVIAPVITR